MKRKLAKPVAGMVAEAKSKITEITAKDALELMGNDAYRFIDIRDIRELARTGTIPGSFHCPRGMAEFWVDPESPYFKPVFGEDKTFVIYCASGFRSALTTAILQEMGLTPVMHISDGFGGWCNEGGPVEKSGGGK